MNLIFDLDGTLIDSSRGILSTLKMVFEQYNLDCSEPLTNKLIGPPLDKLLPILAGTSDPTVILSLATTFKEKYDSNGYKLTTVFGGIEEMLIQLKGQSHNLYLATNKRTIPTRKIIDYFGWNHLFDEVYALDMFLHIANKADLIKHVVQAHQLDKSRTIYIGDTVADSIAATDNDLQYIMASWGYASDGFMGGIAVESPREMSEYFKTLS